MKGTAVNLNYLRAIVVFTSNCKLIRRPARAFFNSIGICTGCGMRRTAGMSACEEELQATGDDELGNLLSAWQATERAAIVTDIRRCLEAA